MSESYVLKAENQRRSKFHNKFNSYAFYKFSVIVLVLHSTKKFRGADSTGRETSAVSLHGVVCGHIKIMMLTRPQGI
jgi:hypothetical protein